MGNLLYDKGWVFSVLGLFKSMHTTVANNCNVNIRVKKNQTINI